jgi:hypothetical protein
MCAETESQTSRLSFSHVRIWSSCANGLGGVIGVMLHSNYECQSAISACKARIQLANMRETVKRNPQRILGRQYQGKFQVVNIKANTRHENSPCDFSSQRPTSAREYQSANSTWKAQRREILAISRIFPGCLQMSRCKETCVYGTTKVNSLISTSYPIMAKQISGRRECFVLHSVPF